MTQKSKIFSLPLGYLLLISSCRSPLSEGNLNNLSAIDARIEIFQDLTDKNKNEVTVLLYDEDGKAIRNKNIKLKVNDIDLIYSEKQELYYTTTSKYSAGDIPVEEAYNLEIVLTNGKPQFLGRIRSLEESNENDIVCNEKGTFDKDHVISWRNLKDINELTIMKSVLLSTSTEMHQNYDAEPQVTTKIGSSGIYLIPKADYISPKSTISMMEVKFSALKFGTMNEELLKGSEIKISGHIDKIIDFNGQSKK